MKRALSPIEMMVNAACGLPPGGDPNPPPITLRCPQCKRTKSVPIDVTDPPGTAVVEALCDKCDDGGYKSEVLYFDAEGRAIGVTT